MNRNYFVKAPLVSAFLYKDTIEDGSVEIKEGRKVKVSVSDLSFKDIERIGLYDSRPIFKATINSRHYNLEKYIKIDEEIYTISNFSRYKNSEGLWVYDLYCDLQAGINLEAEKW